MIIKLINKTITANESENLDEREREKFKCELIMNSDSTATLSFYEILEYR